MRVLLAPDKFKGSATASEVCQFLAAGIRQLVPDVNIDSVPIADGGDGTVDAAVAAGFEAVPVTVTGPTGEPVDCAYARRGDDAVVELASACGLAKLPGNRRDPLGATSRGVGELLAAALDAGCRRIVMGIGGSASTDGGAGMALALGVRLANSTGSSAPAGGGGLTQVAHLDLADLHPGVHEAEIVVACDVDNPLFGPRGAAVVYGPQKGATPDEVAALDAALRHWATVVAATTGSDYAAVLGAGAAGGVGFAAVALLGATLRPGIELLLELVGFPAALGAADLVVTGEGSLDEQTLHGKAPAGVAAAARAAGVTTVAVAGRVTLSSERLAAAGISAAYQLTDIEPDPARCMAEPGPLLEQLAAGLAKDWIVGR
ncbi:MAG: glycerate kinase [Actinomycetota bacterium]